MYSPGDIIITKGTTLSGVYIISMGEVLIKGELITQVLDTFKTAISMHIRVYI
jgi:hypothetical protein